jgi:hypothetical protein
VTCSTCRDEGKILHFYARGPNDAPGNTFVGCPNCVAGREYDAWVKAEIERCLKAQSMSLAPTD